MIWPRALETKLGPVCLNMAKGYLRKLKKDAIFISLFTLLKTKMAPVIAHESVGSFNCA